jgi:DNA polymerase alpha subunit A
LEVVANERALLSLLLAKLHVLDPDVIVGHDLHGFGVDVLLNRMRSGNVGVNWSKLGRLRKSKMPQTNSKPGDGDFSLVDRGAGAGRLLLDTMVCCKEFLTAQKMYTLSFLAETQLRVKHEEVESAAIPLQFKTSKALLELVKHNENDAFLQLSLMFKLAMVPLTKQLTGLCGNMWSRSLRSLRAERVEYLLMHDFHASKFIIPEKYSSRERKERDQAREEEENKKLGPEASKRAAKHKPQYAGGLVLEPKRGFYDKYVLLLDFNSLYPSIIQEFNICFSTVRHWTVRNVGEQAVLPDISGEQGHLPKVIRRLVQRRRNVKDMLKKEQNPTKRKELDIRQKAIKLVANSMYGCLGFVGSRFCQ